MIHFKGATPEDLDTLLLLLPRYYEADGLPYDAIVAKTALEQLLQDDSLGELWLIIDGVTKQALGYIVIAFCFSLEVGGKEAFVDELFVIEERRGQGIGSLAIAHAIHRCKVSKIRAIRLEVTAENDRALNLYKNLGFIDQGRHLLTLTLS